MISSSIGFPRARPSCIARVGPPALGLLGPLPGLVLLDERLFGPDAIELLLVHPLLDQLPLVPLLDERLVVARILEDASRLDLDDAFDHPIEQPAVVADDDHGTVELLGEEVLQPSTAVDVEVVRGFVEEEQVGGLQQEASQPESGLLPTRQRVHGLVEPLVLEPEPVERGVDLVFDGVATERLDPGVERRLPFHQLLEFIRLGRGHRLVDLLELRLGRMQGVEGPRGRLLHGVAGNELRMLAEMADPDATRELHRAVVGLELARDDAEKRALSGPVPADEPDLLRARRTASPRRGRSGTGRRVGCLRA